MALIQWNSSYQVNIESIDEQHQELVAILNKLNEWMKLGKGNEIIGEVLKELSDYTTYHFADEERLMIESRYPDYTPHFNQHTHFINKIDEVYQNHKDGKTFLSADLLYYLKNWLTNHILMVDKEFGDFLVSRNNS